MSPIKPSRPLKVLPATELQQFLEDLNQFLSLPDSEQTEIAAFYVSRDLPYTKVKKDEIEALQSKLALTEDQLEALTKAISYLISQLALERTTLSDIQQDFESVQLGDQFSKVSSFLIEVQSKHPDLARSARKALAGTQTVDTAEGMSFSIDMRAIFKGDQLIDLAPVLLVRLELEGSNESHEVVFQLSKEKLLQLSNELIKQHKRLETAENRVTLINETKTV